jgi:hypothetical protein
MTYECRDCHEAKPRSGFYENSDGSGSGLMKSCKVCFRARVNANFADRKARGAVKPKPLPVYRERGEYIVGRALTAAELVVCPKCSLRGPHECITPRSLGLGQQGWV